MQSLAGSRQRVLIERDGLSGPAENFAPVRFDNPQVPGEIMQVTIRGVEPDRLMADEQLCTTNAGTNACSADSVVLPIASAKVYPAFLQRRSSTSRPATRSTKQSSCPNS